VGQRLDDLLGACRTLWSGAPASFRSGSVSFDDMYLEPRPDDPDAIPIWLGGKCTPRLTRRVARYGHRWMPFGRYGEPLDQIAAQVQQLRQATEAAGRDPSRLDVSHQGGHGTEAFEGLPAMARAGMTVAQTILPSAVQSAAEARPVLDEIARQFQPYRKL
jgi:Luciferase-like monooxygenase